MSQWILGLALAGMLRVPPDAARAAGGSEILAEAEIARLTATYERAVDAGDIDTLMTVFSDDIEYDLAAYGYPNAKGKDAVGNIFLYSVFPAKQCSFINISNIWSEVAGNRATGGDYFLHAGHSPKNVPPLTRRHTKGRHFYRFKKVRGEWKTSYIRGEPFFLMAESIPALPANCPMAPGM